MVTSRNGTGLYSLDLEVALLGPTNAVLETDRYDGEGFYPALFGFGVVDTSTYLVRVSLPASITTQSGDYTLYIVTSDANEIAEVEPNNTAMEAQDLGVVEDAALVAAVTDPMTDTIDRFTFTVEHPTEQLRITLTNSGEGHELRLLDDQEAEIAASGAASDGAPYPIIDEMGLPAGTYSVEFGAGMLGGQANILIQRR